MDIVPMLLAGLGGVFLGMLLTSRVLGWLQAIVEARSNAASPDGAPHTSMFMVALLHSGPWLLMTTVAGGVIAFTKSNAEGWVWFFSGVVITPIVLVPAAVLVSRRKAKSKQQRSTHAA
ncbi:MAG TPA: hypothetical protein VKS43_10250 [Burkholderiales bacterium]|nr:hypothetical protein [Burkholderiales bacterium]